MTLLWIICGSTDKQELLKPYKQCSICTICHECDFKLRDDAKYYVDQMFISDRVTIKDKPSLFKIIVNISKRINNIVPGKNDDSYRKLFYCICIRYIRKAAIETTVVLSYAEMERVINMAMDRFNEQNAE